MSRGVLYEMDGQCSITDICAQLLLLMSFIIQLIAFVFCKILNAWASCQTIWYGIRFCNYLFSRPNGESFRWTNVSRPKFRHITRNMADRFDCGKWCSWQTNWRMQQQQKGAMIPQSTTQTLHKIHWLCELVSYAAAAATNKHSFIPHTNACLPSPSIHYELHTNAQINICI